MQTFPGGPFPSVSPENAPLPPSLIPSLFSGHCILLPCLVGPLEMTLMGLRDHARVATISDVFSWRWRWRWTERRAQDSG